MPGIYSEKIKPRKKNTHAGIPGMVYIYRSINLCTPYIYGVPLYMHVQYRVKKNTRDCFLCNVFNGRQASADELAELDEAADAESRKEERVTKEEEAGLTEGVS